MLAGEKSPTNVSAIELGFYLIASLALMALDSRGGWLITGREFLNTLIEPVYKAAALPQVGVKKVQQSFTDREDLVAQLDTLRDENRDLKVRQLRLESIEAENKQLSRLLSVSRTLNQRVQLSNIVRVDIGANRHEIIINHGKDDGVFVGQPVIDAYGVVGQVVARSAHTSRVTLITDYSHTLPVAIRRNGLRTLVEGNGTFSSLAVRYLALHTDIEEGDVLVTSGLGGRFPAGYPVARISRVVRDANAPFLQIEGVPLATIGRDSHVLLLWFNPPNIEAEIIEEESIIEEQQEVEDGQGEDGESPDNEERPSEESDELQSASEINQVSQVEQNGY